METNAVETDMGIGLSVLFTVLVLGSAAVMLAGGMVEAIGQFTAAMGFAFAMVAAIIAVVVAQIYP